MKLINTILLIVVPFMTEETIAMCDIATIVSGTDKLMEAKYPSLKKRLNPGATDLEIKTFENNAGFTLQPELVEAYKIHNGESEFSSIYGGWRWLPLSGINDQIENFLTLDRDGYSFGYDARGSVPIFYNDHGVLYVKKELENSPLFIRDNDYPEKQDPVALNVCDFFSMFQRSLIMDYFSYSEHEGRGNNTYVHLWAKNGKPWP
jgi:hypothetical protein